MPEGPSIILVAKELKKFAGKTILKASGNASIDIDTLVHKKITSFKTFGKHLLITFPKFTVSIHFLLFGWYSIDEKNRVDKAVRLKLEFKDHTLYFYTCKVEMIEGDINDAYDFSADIMNEKWSYAKAVKKMQVMPDVMICDALMDQNIFAGLGNIIKNEVLYNLEIDPESKIGKMTKPMLTSVAKEASRYSFDFLKWREEGKLQKHWLAYNQKMCSRCNLPMKKRPTGKTKRTSFYCTNCQVKY